MSRRMPQEAPKVEVSAATRAEFTKAVWDKVQHNIDKKQASAEWKVQLEQAALMEQREVANRDRKKDKKHKKSKHKKHSKKEKIDKKVKHHKKHKHSKHRRHHSDSSTSRSSSSDSSSSDSDSEHERTKRRKTAAAAEGVSMHDQHTDQLLNRHNSHGSADRREDHSRDRQHRSRSPLRNQDSYRSRSRSRSFERRPLRRPARSRSRSRSR